MLGRLIAASSITGENLKTGVPFSQTEESDTRALLYGSHFAQDAKLDFNKDLRTTILCDHPACDSIVFDSAAYQSKVSYSVNSIQRLSDGLIKSISSMSFAASNNCHTPPPDNGIPKSPRISRNSISDPALKASSLYMHHYGELPDVLPISLLRQLAFGYTPLKFDKSITKLHLLPAIDDKSSHHSTWLISQVFKVKLPASDCSKNSNQKTRNNYHPRVIERPTESSQLQNVSDELSWNPRSLHLKNSTVKSPGAFSITKEYIEEVRCALCIYLKVPADNPNMIINHWEEILQAVLEAEIHVSRRLFSLLRDPLDDIKSLSPRKSYFMADDGLFIAYSERFRARIANGLHIPRVLCGRDQWNDVFRHIRYISEAFDTIEIASEFLACVIAHFIMFNKKLIQGTLEYGLEPTTRTILLSNHAIYARKLLFILSSLIHGKYAGAHDEISQNVKPFGPGVLRSISSTTSLSGESTCSTKVVEDKKGWDIASSGKAPILQPELAIPCMVRPEISPVQSLSKSLMRSNSTSRFSLDSIYKSMTSNSSVISHRLSQSSNATVFDDDFEFISGESYNDRHKKDSYPGRLSGLFDPPPEFRDNNIQETITSPLYDTRNVQPGVLDVDINFGSTSSENISNDIPPPIAGHISEFHSEFVVQAVPFQKELEERITQAMFNDGHVWGREGNHSTDGKTEDRTISSILIVHLGRKELYQWSLTETGSDTPNTDHEYRQKIVKKKIYPTKRGLHEDFLLKCRGITEKLEKIMRTSESHPTDEQIDELRSAYLSYFDIQ